MTFHPRLFVATLVALFLAVFAMVPYASAQPGAIEPSFGTNGTTLIGFGDGYDDSRVVVRLATGAHLVAGSASGHLTLARYLPTGAADLTFGERGVVRLWSRPSSIALGLDVQSDNRIVVVGYDSAGPLVTRFLADGTFDPTFGAGGFADLSGVPGLSLVAIRVVPGDQILLAGSIDGNVAGTGRFAVCKLTASGSMDSTFDGDGLQSTTIPNGGSASCMALQSDGKIVLGGWARNAGSGYSLALVRYTASGALDTSFDGDGRVITTIGSATASSFVNDIVMQTVSGSPQKLLVAGSTTVSPVNREGVLARYDLSGALDTAFGTGGIVVQAISFGDDTFQRLRFVAGTDRANPARIFVGGYASFPTSTPSALLCSYNISGALNTSFGSNGMVITPIGTGQTEVRSLVFTGERLVVSGYAYQGTEVQDFMLARFLASTGAFDPTFDGDGMVLDDIGDSEAQAQACARQADGRIVLAGSSRGGYLQVVARLNANGSLDSTFSGDARASIVTGGSISYLTDVAVQADQKIVVMGTTLLNNVYRVTVARLLPSGSLDPSFGNAGLAFLPPRSPSDISAGLAIQSDGRLLLASAAWNGTDDSVRVTRLLATGQVDVSFGTGGTVMLAGGGYELKYPALALQPDGRSLVVGQRRRYVFPQNLYEVVAIRLTSTGALDATFGVGGVATILAGSDQLPADVLVQSDGRIVVTGVQQVSSAHRNSWAFRLTASGQPDSTYGTQGYRLISEGAGEDRMAGATLQSFDRLLVAGNSGPSYATSPQLARLVGTGSLDPLFAGDGIATLDLGASSTCFDILTDVPGGFIMVAGESRGLMSLSAIQPGAALAGVDDAPDAPDAHSLALAAPWPNPSRGAVTLALRLGAPSSLSADVLDVQGRHVRALAEGKSFAAGEARLRWDGRDAEGRLAAAGLYFVRVRTERGVVTRRIVLAR